MVNVVFCDVDEVMDVVEMTCNVEGELEGYYWYYDSEDCDDLDEGKDEGNDHGDDWIDDCIYPVN